MKHKKQKKVHGLLNRPLFEHIAVFGVAALVAGFVAYIGVSTDKGDVANTRAPTVKNVVHETDAASREVQVIISGSNFAPGATVYLGETLLPTVTFVSPGTLRAVSTLQPAEGATIMVKNPDGQESAIRVTAPGNKHKGGEVNALDLSVLISHFGRQYPPADHSKDGKIDAVDLSVLLGSWTW